MIARTTRIVATLLIAFLLKKGYRFGSDPFGLFVQAGKDAERTQVPLKFFRLGSKILRKPLREEG